MNVKNFLKHITLLAISSSTLWSNPKLEPVFLTNVLLHTHNKEDLKKAILVSKNLGEAFKMLRKNPIAIQNESEALATFPKIETQVVYDKKDTLINNNQVTQRIIAYTFTFMGMLYYSEINSKVTSSENPVTEIDFNKGTGEHSRKFSREVNGKTIFFSNGQYTGVNSLSLRINYHRTERGTVSIPNNPYVIPYGINSLPFFTDTETPLSIRKIEVYDNPLKQFILDRSTLYIPTTLKEIGIYSSLLFDIEEITIPTGASSCELWRILKKHIPHLQKLTIDLPNKDKDKHIWRCDNHCFVYSGNSFYRLDLPNNSNLQVFSRDGLVDNRKSLTLLEFVNENPSFVSLSDTFFINYTTLNQVIIPDTITHISPNCFWYYDNLQEIRVKRTQKPNPKFMKTLEEALMAANKLGEVKITLED